MAIILSERRETQIETFSEKTGFRKYPYLSEKQQQKKNIPIRNENKTVFKGTIRKLSQLILFYHVMLCSMECAVGHVFLKVRVFCLFFPVLYKSLV